MKQIPINSLIPEGDHTRRDKWLKDETLIVLGASWCSIWIG